VTAKSDPPIHQTLRSLEVRTGRRSVAATPKHRRRWRMNHRKAVNCNLRRNRRRQTDELTHFVRTTRQTRTLFFAFVSPSPSPLPLPLPGFQAVKNESLVRA